jgi:hypothetical protein
VKAMAKDLVELLFFGAIMIFIGIIQIKNVRRALKTGVISLGIRDTSRLRAADRRKNPIIYHLNFWPCLFAAMVLPLMGASAIGYAIFLMIVA